MRCILPSIRTRHLTVAGLLLSLTAVGCENDLPLEPEGDDIVISGPVINFTEQEIPGNARVLVLWSVSSGTPDYTYVFGEGVLLDGGTSFQVELPEAPPAAALNADLLGVGFVVLTTNQDAGLGDDLADIPTSEILGVTGWHGVIYLNRDPNDLPRHVSWASEFNAGYNVGQGVEAESSFDWFEPVAPGTMELIVDDLQNIEIVNWT